MKKNFAQLLASVTLITAGFSAAPASAIPMVTLSIDAWGAGGPAFSNASEETDSDGFLFSNNTALTTASRFAPGPLVTTEVAEIMDSMGPEDGYGMALGLSYSLEVNDPSPTTPRNWDLSLDLAVEGDAYFDPIFGFEFDESFSEGPINDLSVADAALFGQHLLGWAATELAPVCAILGSEGPFIGGECFGENVPFLHESTGPLSGNVFVGLSTDATGLLLFDILPLDILTESDGFFVAASADLTLTEAVSVPEPGMLALLGFGLVGIGLAKRRSKA